MAIATLIGRMKEWLVHSKRIDAHLRRRANASIASCRLSVARRHVHQTLGMVASNRNPSGAARAGQLVLSERRNERYRRAAAAGAGTQSAIW